MKRISIFIMALLSIVVMSSFVLMETGKRSRSIDNLWSKYEKARDKDRIQDMIDILEDIKEQAAKEKSAASYFRACDEYVNARSRQNWKLTEQLISSTKDELHEYGEPMLEILFGLRHGESTASLLEKIGRDAESMKKSENGGIYDFYPCDAFVTYTPDSDGKFYALMRKSLKNDYEYIMWMLMSSRGYDCGPACDEFVEYLDGAYPAVTYINYLRLNYNSKEARKAGFEKMAEEYAGRGMGVVAVDELLSMKFNELDDKGTSEEYRMLEKEAEEALAARKALKGDEAAVAEIYFSSGHILVMLGGKEAEIRIKKGDAHLFLRNLDRVRFMIKNGEDVVFETEVVNPHKSFYKMDTLKVELPVLDDDEYIASVYNGKDELASYDYEKYTVSLATRFAADGMCVYAADYMTGEPVEKADLILYDNGMKKEVVAEVKDFIFNGFTKLPENIYPLRDNKGYRLVCRYEKDGHVRSSKPLYIGNKEIVQSRSEMMTWARVVQDRAAYVPGDTVRFKAFLYEDYPDGRKVTFPAGEEVYVEVEDPSGKVVTGLTLTTNEFGTAAGSFVVDGKGQNGRWTILVKNSIRINAVEPSSFTVDEFVLPSYDLTFNEADRLYFPGDEIKVTGQVMSYSGHGLGGLNASASIYVNHKFVEEKSVRLAPDGSFEVCFVAGESGDEYVNYRIEMRLTDNTGETLEFYWNSEAVREIDVRAGLMNADRGAFGINPDDGFFHKGVYGGDGIISVGTVEIRCGVISHGGELKDIPLSYELRSEGKVLKSGSVMSGGTLALDMKDLTPGLYEVEFKASVAASDGREVTSSKSVRMLYMPDDEDVVPCRIERMFRTSYEGGVITMQFGSGKGPVWAVMELFGKNSVPLKQEIVHVNGKAGEKGSLATLVIPHLDEYSEKVMLHLTYFKGGKEIRYQETFERTVNVREIPLEFSSFVDKALPGQEVSIKMKTDPAAEVLVSVFDASSQKIDFNSWENMRLRAVGYPINVSYSFACGSDETSRYSNVAIGYGTGRRKAARIGNYMMVSEAMAYDSVAEAESVPSRMAETKSSFMDVSVRDDFASTLAFEPFLRPSEDGTAEMKFRTSGKLSTFIVKAMAHDKSMNTAFADREMVVSLPVRVSVVQPQYLYAGDKYVLRASVSNVSQTALKGRLSLEIFNGDKYVGVEPVRVESAEVDVPAGGSSAVSFDVPVPSDVDSLGFKVVFEGYEYSSSMAVTDVLISDGMFVSVPVYLDAQVLTEAHSAVLLGGRSADELIAGLRDEFVNVSSVGAEYEEVSVMDMIREALPVAYAVEEKDAVSLSEAMCVNFMAAGLRAGDESAVRACVEAAMGAVEKLLSCVNDDGGFAWFEGMSSSPVVTALVLERYARLSDRRLLDIAQLVWGEDSLDDLDSAMYEAVKYLDSSYFGDAGRPFWYGRLSLGQYMNVRSMFAGVTFDETAARKAMGAKKFKEFRRAVKEYLTPKSSGLRTEGDVLSKVRMIRIINNLTYSDAGLSIASAWGAPSERRLRRSMAVELESLMQYAVEHPSGGIYYPNAVMPWRGLLESEAYAHASICDLFKEAAETGLADAGRLNGLADGIRIWLMLQKETQKWDSDPGFVEALAAVCDGSAAVKETKVIVLSKRYLKPFGEIKAAGNGFKVSVDYYKEGADGGRVRLAEGDSLHVGDKITAVYSLWSQENRSHVRLSVPRAACFRPVEQLSGWSGGWFRPLAYGISRVSPYSYREVKADRTLWWIDVFPEENTTIEEQLFVTQEGTFTAPVAEIESVYAPHYRANGGFAGQAVVR